MCWAIQRPQSLSAQHMDMPMLHHLSGIIACVSYDAIPAVANALALGHPRRILQQLAGHVMVRFRQCRHGRNVLFRYAYYMHPGLGRNVSEKNCIAPVKNHIRRRRAFGNPAENAILVAILLAHLLIIELLFRPVT